MTKRWRWPLVALARRCGLARAAGARKEAEEGREIAAPKAGVRDRRADRAAGGRADGRGRRHAQGLGGSDRRRQEDGPGASRSSTTWATASSRASRSSSSRPIDADLAVRAGRAATWLQADLAKLGPPGELPRAATRSSSVAPRSPRRPGHGRPGEGQAEPRARADLAASAAPARMQDYQNAENDEQAAEAALANAVLDARRRSSPTRIGQPGRAGRCAKPGADDMEIRAPFRRAPPKGDAPAPITYAVSKRSVSEGQMLKEGEAVVDLVDREPAPALDQRPRAVRRRGQASARTCGSRSPSYPGQTFDGQGRADQPVGRPGEPDLPGRGGRPQRRRPAPPRRLRQGVDRDRARATRRPPSRSSRSSASPA